MRALYQRFSHALKEIADNVYSIDIDHPLWEVPKEKKYGDFSTMIALKIASRLKCDPIDVASNIREILKNKFADDVDRIEIIKPGFVNIFISPQALIAALNNILEEKSDFFREIREKKVLLEFVSANPTGPLSIAHGRQAVIGDAIARVLEFFGNEVVREYYINNEGRQIDLLVKSVEERIKEIEGKDFSFPEDGYRGEYIKDIAQEARKTERINVRDFTLSQLLVLIKSNLSQLGVVFDSWFSQGKLIQDGEAEEAIEFLKSKKLVYKKEDALWFASSKFGDDKDRVLKKSDGELTYFASDIAYHKNKIQRQFDKLINLWGPDHHGYVNRVKAAIKAIGVNPDILDVIIIQLVSIKTKERMSRRRGTALLLSDLIKEVGRDAARFYYLLRKNSSPLEFDIDLAKSISFDNPLYYIQYAHARILSIFRKGEVKEFSPDFSHLLEEEELNLIRDILQFNYCLDKVYYNLEPVFLITYLKNIASNFHQFYERKRVLDTDKNKTMARLNLLEATRIVIDCGLNILGIKPLVKM